MGLRIKYSREVVKVAAIWKIPLKDILGGVRMDHNDYSDGVT